MTGPKDRRLRRLRIRSWRRGTREMDLILGRFADDELETLSDDDLVTFDDLLNEGDQDIYAWVAGRSEPPQRFRAMIERLSRRHGVREDSSST